MKKILIPALALCAACSAGRPGGGDDGDDGGDDDPHPPDASIGECEATSAGTFTFEKIADWVDDSTAAYSMIHDDMCGPALNGILEQAVPALEERGLTAGLAPFVQACEDAQL